MSCRVKDVPLENGSVPEHMSTTVKYVTKIETPKIALEQLPRALSKLWYYYKTGMGTWK